MSEKSTVTSGWKARQFVKELKPFHNNSKSGTGPNNSTLWGERVSDELYVVYSYRRGWPIYINWKGVWFSNEDKYSPTTSKHQSQTHPLVTTVPLPRRVMCDFTVAGEPPMPEVLVKAAMLNLLPDELIPEATRARITA